MRQFHNLKRVYSTIQDDASGATVTTTSAGGNAGNSIDSFNLYQHVQTNYLLNHAQR